MAFIVEEDESFDPIEICLFGAHAKMPEPNASPDLVEQFAFFHWGPPNEVAIVKGMQ